MKNCVEMLRAVVLAASLIIVLFDDVIALSSSVASTENIVTLELRSHESIASTEALNVKMRLGRHWLKTTVIPKVLSRNSIELAINLGEHKHTEELHLEWKEGTQIIEHLIANISYTHLKALLPKAPTNGYIEIYDEGYIRVNWTDNSDNETGFKIERSTTIDGLYKSVGQVGRNNSSFVDFTAKEGIDYYYRISALIDEGYSLAIISGEGTADSFDRNAAKSSGIVHGLVITEVNKPVQIFPSRAEDRLNVKINNRHQGRVLIILRDLQGEQILLLRYNKFGDILEEEIDLSVLTAGSYIVEVVQHTTRSILKPGSVE